MSDKNINIGPDYTETTAQVYQDVVLRHIEHHEGYDMLAYCELQSDRPAEMPTWVSNWAVGGTAIAMDDSGRACSHSCAQVDTSGVEL